jgi:hypothetical protein
MCQIASVRRRASGRSKVGRQVQAARLQHRTAASERALPDRVEDDVIAVVLLGEVHRVTVDDPLGAEPTHKLDMRGSADRGHLHTEVGEQLHGGAADRPRRAVDERILAAADARLPDDRKCVVRTLGARGNLLKRQTVRDRRDQPVPA